MNTELKQQARLGGISKKFVLRLFISSFACLFLAYKIDWSEFANQLKDLHLMYLFLAFAAVITCIVISAYKWFLLCRLNGEVTFYQCFRWYYIGFFFNNFLPGSIGGDVSRIIYASKVLGSQQAVASVSVERLFAGIALIVTTVTGILSINEGASLLGQVSIFVMMISFFIAVIFFKPFEKFMIRIFGEKITSFYKAIEQYKQKSQILWLLLFYSILFQIFFVFVTTYLFKAMGVSVPFMAQVAFVSIISILTMIPISINGIGVREGAYAYLFALVGVAEFISITVSLLFFILVLVGTSIGGLFWITEKNR
ncbi:lysylphosphatidylglycerol synthase transmembrane domain-containing protein [Anaerobacillus isosaccharinicus]|uniref:Phosphatidylglycerol lysyltransferase n=1 Tax=Anaerobacillus isosaccharinicus TaxID=1532552 RepID=A0A1S2M2Y1_9BACI|nr:lysylphosphatidylglycerol synthase transmembrane domain-containing protein [Anaerobacillus isosaccharinicus]MBA5588237.1 flippase-like domain-containing protein [Anaerobacillus isosaccharinicus]QOY38317.1 flippase-like domain-containing protein [Anaerobacillus isosaccharinicus]